jgi:hypothetical protein
MYVTVSSPSLLSSRFWARAAGTVVEVRCRVRQVTIVRQARKFLAAPVALKADKSPVKRAATSAKPSCVPRRSVCDRFGSCCPIGQGEVVGCRVGTYRSEQ